jgi:hypothetical protein
MKHFLTLLTSLLLAGTLMAQSVPQGMQYQAVARDAEGNILADQAIGIRINLLADGKKDASVYLEEHQTRTNELGLFTLTIGAGEVIAGNFTEVPWAEHEIWMSLSLDASGDGRYKMLSKSRLLAVPYAFHAGSAGTIAGTQAQQGEGQRTHNGGIQWHLLGNRNANPDFFFLGTIDENDLVIKTNNSERMRITADGEVNIDGDLSVGNNALIGNDLQVNNNANIDNNLKVGGITDLDSDLNVNNMGATSLSGILTVDKATSLKDMLTVDGVADFNDALNVNNGSSTYLSGRLTVDSSATFNARMTVDASLLGSQSDQTTYPMLIKGSEQGLAIQVNPSYSNIAETGRGNNYVSFWTDENTMTGRIEGMTRADLDPTGLLSLVQTIVSNPPSTVDLNPDIGSILDLPGLNASSGFLDIIGNFVKSVDIDNPSQSSFDPGSFSSLVNDAFSDNSASLINQFNVVVGDDMLASGNTPATAVWNAISSQLCDEDGIFQQAVGQEGATNFKSQIFSNYTLDILNGSISTFGSIITLASSLASVFDPEDVLANAVDLSVDIINLIIYGAYADINIGVAYESGSGDYAEWLERAIPQEDIKAGDVVGVIGGKVSKTFTHAERFMVVSTAPIVLGNMPKDAAGETLSEKIAFMGQVPVKVQGEVEIGDYILPSGNGDGIAIAVAADEMKARDYQRIVGVAWEASEPNAYISLVNTAVGINHNDMSRVIEDMQHTLNQLQAAVKELKPDYNPRMYDVNGPTLASDLDYSVASTHPANLAGYLPQRSYESKEEMLQDIMRVLEEQIGVDFEQVPIIEYILSHPEQAEEIAAYYQDMMEGATALRNDIKAEMQKRH